MFGFLYADEQVLCDELDENLRKVVGVIRSLVNVQGYYMKICIDV